jgi:hypothetical protein
MQAQARVQWLSTAALVVAVLAAVAVIALPPTPRADAPNGPAGPPPALASGLVTTTAGTLTDGSSYGLRYVLSKSSSVGTSLAAQDGTYRLLWVVDGRPVLELRRLPVASGPQFDGFTSDDGHLYWAETATAADGLTHSQLWQAPIGSDDTVGQPRRLVDDMGPAIFYDSAYDLVVADGTITWVVVTGSIHPGTILRSMPIGGGPITDRGFAGPWRQIARPWLASAAGGGNASMLNVTTGQVVSVPATASDNVECSPQWCRFTVQGPGGPVRCGIMRPDGSQNTRVAGPDTQFQGPDPALLGRYELLSEEGSDLPTASRRLLVFDHQQGSTRLIETAPGGLATSRGSYAWWISGDFKAPDWHVLDLKALD